MANPRKTKSGKWNIRVYSHTDKNGKQIYKCITASSRLECERLALQYRENNGFKRNNRPLTVGEIVDMYIDLNAQTLAATTLNSYRRMRTNSFNGFWNTSVDDLSDIVVQRAINAECKRTGRYGDLIKPKTIKEEWGLIAASLKRICNKQFNVTLPRRVRNIKDYPDPIDVMAAIIGSPVELPCMMALWLSFTMSEIRGIRYSSIRNNRIFIERVRVDMPGEKDIVKDIAKVDTRNRKHDIPPEIQILIDKDEGYAEYLKTGEDDWLIKGSAHSVYMRFKRLMKKNNIDLTFHQLRHLNASILMTIGIPDKYIMERDGWKSAHVMNEVYKHTLSKERLAADVKVNDYFRTAIQQAKDRNV